MKNGRKQLFVAKYYCRALASLYALFSKPLAYVACLNILGGSGDIGDAWLVCEVIECLWKRNLIREGREI